MSFQAWLTFQNIVRAAPTQPAVLHGASTYSFAELEELALCWAATLNAKPGERVLLYAENTATTAAAVLGIWRLGAVPVWINSAAPLDHVRLALEETSAVAIVASALEDSGLSCPVYRAPESGGALELPQPEGDGSSLGSIVYTSGSTGRPKGVVQKAETLIDGARRVADTFGYRAQDRILCPVPFAFDYGWGQLLSMLLTGVTLVLPEPQNAFGLCDAITRHRPTVFAGVPAVFANLLSGLSPIRETDCSSVRLITNTGSRLPETVQEQLWQTFPTAALSLNYGLTETYRSASLPVALAKAKPHSVGPAFPGAQIIILDEDGVPCPPNVTGEIIHRGAGIFERYWNDPERTALVRRPDPLDPGSGRVAVYTGDLGHLDEEGHLVITGRRDRQMKSMGVRVSPDEVEDILAATGLMAEVAITSRRDDTIGDMIVAFVVGHPNADHKADLKALKQKARDCLSPYMMPRLFFLLDALPRNPNKKVDYVSLKKRAAAEI
ncbi:class I adenylate-forming enzyme family protein [Pseudorhodobacter aquimaris]|uniref:class I adenylate-forming enzyme family protein n=1 Tax=Pseudorhodobacter aquimaris TaxID=687412 RepID=UPI00067D4938|nr:AMP-binding protein [Pseudorhodobacter aquimaris]